MQENKGQFRFTYFTDKYDETFNFYSVKLGLKLEHSWDRNKHDKGALFRAGPGLIEVLHLPSEQEKRYEGLDYRLPQGAFMGIQVWNINVLFQKYKEKGVTFKHELVDQPWGHRTFYVLEPNGLVLFFFQEQFDS